MWGRKKRWIFVCFFEWTCFSAHSAERYIFDLMSQTKRVLEFRQASDTAAVCRESVQPAIDSRWFFVLFSFKLMLFKVKRRNLSQVCTDPHSNSQLLAAFQIQTNTQIKIPNPLEFAYVVLRCLTSCSTWIPTIFEMTAITMSIQFKYTHKSKFPGGERECDSKAQYITDWRCRSATHLLCLFAVYSLFSIVIAAVFGLQLVTLQFEHFYAL